MKRFNASPLKNPNIDFILPVLFGMGSIFLKGLQHRNITAIIAQNSNPSAVISI